MILEMLLQAVPVTAPPAAAEIHKCFSAEMVAAISGAMVLVIAAIAGAADRVIRSIRETVRESSGAIVTEQSAGRRREQVHARNQVRIHYLVNSRFTAALRAVVVLAKEKAERTKDPDDIEALRKAAEELDNAERPDSGLETADEEWDGTTERRRFHR